MKRLVVMFLACILLLAPGTNLAQPAKSGVKKLVIALHSESANYDISNAHSAPLAELVCGNVNEKLLGITTDGKLIPGLAESWKASPSGKEIEFSLRKGVKYHSGDALTARDIEFSIQRMIKYVPAFRNRLRLVDRVEVIDDNRFKIIFKDPDATFLTLRGIYVVSKAYFDRVGEAEFIKKSVGTGPYKIVNWEPGQYIDLVANENYWGEKPAIKEVRYVIVPEGTTRMAKLQTGEADIALEIPFPMVKPLEQAGFKVVRIPAHPSISVQFQTVNPKVPWYDKRVRLAIAMGIDANAIVNNLFQGVPEHYARLAPWEMGYDPKLKAYPYDPAGAKNLLAQAGYPNGFEMPLIYSVGRAAGFKEATEAVALYLNAIGLRVKIQGIEAVQFMEKIKFSWHGKPDAEFVGITPVPVCQYPDPSILLEDGYFSESIISLCANTELDKLTKAVRIEMNEKKREELAQKAVAIIHDEVLTIPISANKMVYALGKNIEFTPTVRTEFPLMLIKDVKMK